MKKIVLLLQGMIVKVVIDATCKKKFSCIVNCILTIYNTDNTNSKHLELYTVLSKYNNFGFPLSYCLLTTASSVDVGKRTRALEAWVTVLCNKYGIHPRFVHTDKDMAEIGASRRVWPEAKHQLCWWHQCKAVWRRLKGNLPTSIYNPLRARDKYGFIDLGFRPHGCADPNNIKGNVPGVFHEQDIQRGSILRTSNDPNSIKIHIPIQSSQSTQVDHASMTPLAGTLKLATWIPASLPSCETNLCTGDESDEETTNGRHTFCPIEFCAAIVDLMEHHFCAHPLIPGYSALTPNGIKAWAVKQMYQFCVHWDLPNLWAYLWENWYWRGRWELWAQSGNPHNHT